MELSFKEDITLWYNLNVFVNHISYIMHYSRDKPVINSVIKLFVPVCWSVYVPVCLSIYSIQMLCLPTSIPVYLLISRRIHLHFFLSLSTFTSVYRKSKSKRKYSELSVWDLKTKGKLNKSLLKKVYRNRKPRLHFDFLIRVTQSSYL
jgi:hypothetical protein